MCLRRGRDGRAHLVEQGGTFVHILTRAGAEAEMVQAGPLLHEALASPCRIAWFDANRGPRPDAVEEPFAVGHHLHPELGQEATIELAGRVKAADRQYYVRHPIDFDGH
jgi:hypothetical protein